MTVRWLFRSSNGASSFSVGLRSVSVAGRDVAGPSLFPQSKTKEIIFALDGSAGCARGP